MKTILYALMTILLLSSATCRNVQPGTRLERELIGEWKYIGKSGGYVGKYEKADPRQDHTLQFKSGLGLPGKK